jgi:hypothetical protein
LSTQKELGAELLREKEESEEMNSAVMVWSAVTAGFHWHVAV